MTTKGTQTTYQDKEENALTSKFEEVQLIYRNRTPAANRPKINNPQSAYDVLLKHWDMDQIDLVEECKALLLDNGSKLMSIAPLFKGGISETVVDLRIIFSVALKRRASSIILAHNHPSGNLKPSKPDLVLTRNIIKAGEIMQIPLYDHLIITREGYTSLIGDGHVDCELS